VARAKKVPLEQVLAMQSPGSAPGAFPTLHRVAAIKVQCSKMRCNPALIGR
jgi:hypothetical protein